MSTREVDGRRIEVSNLDKPLWPDDDLTKGDLLDYYERVADLLLPHVAGRPLTLFRAPDGIDDESWYQKDAAGAVPDWVRTARLEGWEEDDVRHAVADEPATLVLLAQLAAIELHAGPCPVDDLDHPAELVLDLDPPGRRDDDVRWAARRVRALLEDELGLATFVKASGSKGFHVHVPLDGTADVDTTRRTARTVAELLARRHPERLTVEQRKRKRTGRVFVDWLRNHPTQTAVAPYSVRARPGAPVAVPLEWDELSRGVDPDAHTIRSVFRRLGQRDDPWTALDEHRQGLDGVADRLEDLGR